MNNRKVSTVLLCAGVLGAAGIAWSRVGPRRQVPTAAPSLVSPVSVPASAQQAVEEEAPANAMEEDCPYVAGRDYPSGSDDACPYAADQASPIDGDDACPYVEKTEEDASYAEQPQLMNNEDVTASLPGATTQSDGEHAGIHGGGVHPTAIHAGPTGGHAPPGHGTSPPQVAVPQPGEITPVSGSGGATIQALHARKRESLKSQVRVRGRVVRVVLGVMGTNFVHLRDGTGSDANGDADLAVTMDDPPPVGETVVVEGTLISDRDVGTGFVYRVLLDKAKRLSPEPEVAQRFLEPSQPFLKK